MKEIFEDWPYQSPFSSTDAIAEVDHARPLMDAPEPPEPPASYRQRTAARAGLCIVLSILVYAGFALVTRDKEALSVIWPAVTAIAGGAAGWLFGQQRG